MATEPPRVSRLRRLRSSQHPMVRRAIVPLAARALILKERVRSGVVWNPLDHRYHQDPFPYYARLRDRDPVHRSELMRGWVVTRFDDVDAVLRDHARFSSDIRKSPVARDAVRRGAPVPDPSMLVIDPPDHTRLRALVSKAFTRGAIESWRSRIEQIADELLDEVDPDAGFDVMASFANPLPVRVIAEMLGVPPEDFPFFKDRSDAVARQLEPTSTLEQGRASMAAREELTAYLDRIATERRREPREDLLSYLLAAEDEGDRLTHHELLLTLRLLLVAGNETTTNLIGNGLLALLRHPDQLAWLQQHPGRVDDAIEELLRFDSPVQADQRTAVAEIELGGRSIVPGEQIILLLGAANRDERHFADPDRLDLTRTDRSHISFGRGIHYCVGAPLARLEGHVAFSRLIDRFPSLRLADPEPRFKDHVVLRGLERLSVIA